MSFAAAPSAARVRPRLTGALAAELTGVGAGLGAGLGAALAAVAFAAGGGQTLGEATWAEVCLVVAGGVVLALALAVAPSTRRLWGAGALALFAALAVWTALSVGWSVSPEDSWREANRTFAYLAVFAAGAALARLAPGRWRAMLGAVLAACVAVAAWSLLTKALPAELAPAEQQARLRAPFAYWNAVGLMAALGVPPCLWLGARREGHGAASALAVPAAGLLLLTVILAQSRGALLALAAGLVLWFAVVPLRLRGFAVLAAAVVGAVLAAVWTFGHPALTDTGVALAAREDAGGSFAVLVLLLVLVLAGVGLALGFLNAELTLPSGGRRRAGLAVLLVLALGLLAGLGALQTRPGGVPGQVSSAWHNLTNTHAKPPRGPARLTTTASAHARYWEEAWRVSSADRWRGAGAGGFAIARQRISRDDLVVQHAHGYGPQTLADLGLVGVGLSLALLAAWWRAARRAAPLRAGPREGERAGLVTLLAVVVIFGVHSAVDWTWFVPGTAAVGLVAAGWLAARGPLDEPTGSRVRPGPGRLGAAAGALAVVLIAAWTALGPLGAQSATDRALGLASRGDLAGARDGLASARSRDPLALEPRFALAELEGAAGRGGVARSELVGAVRTAPQDFEPWQRLGEWDADHGRATRAGSELAAARALAPYFVPNTQPSALPVR